MRRKVIAVIIIAISFSFVGGCGAIRQQQIQQQRVEYLNTHPELEDSIRSAINQRQLLIGMTMEQVRVSWGPPRSTITTSHGRDSWTYEWTDLSKPFALPVIRYHLSFVGERLESWTKYD